MQTDARAGSHPIITPITDVLQAANAFDVITYAKGSAVIRMLEAYVGDDVWRAGVRLYLRDHAYGVAQTQAFWTALDTVSTRPVTGIAHDFTLQAGVPMISLKAADCRRTVTRLELQQGVFTPEGQSAQARIWRVPLAAAVLAAAPSSAVVAGPADQAVTVAGCGPVVLNAGQSAYAVSRYAPNALAALADHFGDLEPVDQLGVLGDTAALSLAGLQPMSAYLSLMQRIAPRSDPVVLSAMISDLRVLDQLYGGLPERSLFRRYAAALLRPILDRTGWTAAKGEDDSMALLRTNVLNALASLEDGAVLTEARRLFDRWQADPGSADSATRRLVLSIVAVHAEPEVWRRLHQSAKTLSTALGREELYALLGTTEDPALARAALDLSLSGEPEPTTAPDMIRAVAVLWPKLALSFVIEHWPQISPLLEPGARAAFAPQLIEQANDPSLIPELEAFAQAHIPKSDRQDVLKAEAAVRDHDRIRTSRLPQADRWLEAQERPGSQSLPADRLFSAR
jgi:aminopeptidase N